MTSIQFFYNRDFPGNALRSNARQALDRLGMKPEMRETEAAPEQVGAPLPALAIDGEIVVSGMEPSVRELEILFEDHAQEGEEDSACVRHGVRRRERHGALPHVRPARGRRQRGGQDYRLRDPAHYSVPCG